MMHFLRAFWIFIILGSAGIAFCATDAELQQMYQAAIDDARIAEASEIDPNLTPVIESNTNITWRGEPGNKKIVLTTWTSWDGYDKLIGKVVNVNSLPSSYQEAKNDFSPMGQYQVTRDIWVTVAPELKNFIRNQHISFEKRSLRCEQLIGLPPNGGKTRFVEFLVDPKDIFRPSPDPEITDTVAELDFPANVSETHKTWINTTKSVIYDSWKFPWTRLGYTYDWGNPVPPHIGLSEYIIPQRDANPVYVEVFSVKLNADFFASNSEAHNWEMY